MLLLLLRLLRRETVQRPGVGFVDRGTRLGVAGGSWGSGTGGGGLEL